MLNYKLFYKKILQRVNVTGNSELYSSKELLLSCHKSRAQDSAKRKEKKKKKKSRAQNYLLKLLSLYFHCSRKMNRFLFRIS